MNKMQTQVREFHEAFGVPVNNKPVVSIDHERLELRAKLIHKFNLAEIADGLTDLKYVTFGADIELGLDAEKCFDCVHDVNMAKAWTEEDVNFYYIGGGIDKEKLAFTPTAAGRFAAQREDGKIKKSPSFKAPDLSSVISKQMI